MTDGICILTHALVVIIYKSNNFVIYGSTRIPLIMTFSLW